MLGPPVTPITVWCGTKQNWIAVASTEPVRRGREAGFMQVCHGKAAPLRRVRPGDLVACYSPTREFGGKEKYQAFTSFGIVRDAKPYHFDMGGHRFFTKVDEVKKIWHDVLGGEFLRRPRLSRIYYDGRFFNYPLKPLNALAGLGVWRALMVVLSYLRWQVFPYRQEDTFEQFS